MLKRVVRMTFQEDKVGAFLDNFNQNKEKIRTFPGCQHLELWKDENFNNIFITYSFWEDEVSLNQYRDSELFKSVWAAIKPLFLEKPSAFSAKKLVELP